MNIKNENIDIDAILEDIRFKEAHFTRKEEICRAIIDYIETDKLKQQPKIFLTPKVILRNFAAAAAGPKSSDSLHTHTLSICNSS